LADVIDFAARKKAAAPSVETIIHNCIEEIEGNWERFARNNRLNDYFLQSTPAWAEEDIDYLSDLNAISRMEMKINLLPLIQVRTGWLAGFTLTWTVDGEAHEHGVQTPMMFTEPYARCFNILLCLKLRRELGQAGIHLT